MSDFNSQVELLQWIIDGNKAEFEDGTVYFAKDGIVYYSTRTNENALFGSFNDISSWHKFKKVTKWYESINQDDKSTWKICKVWDYDEEQFSIDLVKNMSPDDIYKFEGINNNWANARPLTEEEFKNPVLLYEDNEDE